MNITDKPGKVVSVSPVTPSGSTNDDGIKYDENLRPNRPAFKDEKEVHELCENLLAQNKDRNKRDATILDIYFYKPPYVSKKLVDAGYGWSANVPSGFLAAAVGAVQPAFRRSANGVKYLTNAKIKSSTKKTEALQDKVTKFIRMWDGWQDFLECVTAERTLLGRSIARATDAYDWRPRFYTTQKALLPEQCPQRINDIPMVAFWDEWMPHDFVSNIKNVKVAKANGWDIENCVKVLNSATPKDGSGSDERTMVSWLADGAYSKSYTAKGPVYVETYTVFVVEPDEGGKVSEWVVGKENGELLYKKLNKYSKMSDAVAAFTFSQGNSTMHSSRGFGRLLMPATQTYDRNFCKLLDDYYLSGMRVIHPTDRKKLDSVITIRSPFIYAPAGSKSEPMNSNINVEIYYALVRQLTALARQIAGVHSPASILPEDKAGKTATEATIDAAKEGELREGVLSRWAAELSGLVWMMTRRILDPKTYDPEAKAFQKELMDEGFTPEELKEFSESAPTDHISSYSTAIRNDKILKFIAVAKGNPAYDQRRLAYLVAETMVDPDFAKEVVVVHSDPELDAQAIHDQDIETNIILKLGGKIMPGPLDNDIIHLQSALKDVTAFIQGTDTPQKQELRGLMNMSAHMEAHIQQAEMKGAKPKELKQFVDFIKELQQQIALYANNLVRNGQGGPQGPPPLQQQPPAQPPQGEPGLPAGGGPVGIPPIGPA